MTLLLSRRRLLATAGMLSLAGCSLLPDPRAPQMYRLNPADLDPTNAPVPRGSLAIDRPQAPENLDSDRIALTRGATLFDYYADASWTDRVPALLQNLLVEAFETDGRVADVWTDPDSMTSGYLLQTEVRTFTARYDHAARQPPDVVLALDCRLLRLPLRRTVGHVLIEEREAAQRNKLGDVVRAFDVATGKALNRCVAWTLREMQSA